MTQGSRMPRYLLAAALAWCIAGCGQGGSSGGSGAGDDTALKEVGEMYRMYTSASKGNKPPARLDDLKGTRTVAQNGYDAVKKGSIIVLWSAPMTDFSEEGGGKDAADEVLAYEKNVPAQGGKVLMLDRSVKTMTADEFKSAKKAGKEAPATSPSKKG
jgi:hypothetical protein